GRLLDRTLDRGDVAEEAHGVLDPELLRERAECGLERSTAGEAELEGRDVLPCLGERAQQDDMALDRDQPPDARQARRVAAVRPGLAVGLDAVVDDLEAS